ncbi:MAG: 3-deoxy-manno-octulosonate cytidylyltransferase [Planctomycetaceae bacterium]|nr:3-deoxy-manno-octulosonate cytidylyltransferase [Planctomycetaceae bacterium]
MAKSVVVIPARYASTRLPRKLLLNETGKPLIQYTYESALRAALPENVSVACDHEEIFEAVKSFGGTVYMTNPEAKNGTERIAEVAEKLTDTDIIVNVQGDEPELSGEAIDLVIQMLMDNPAAVMSTLCTPIRNRQQLEDPACVKVVFDKNGKALYFSRSVIPHPRNGIKDEMFSQQPPLFYQHIGMYAYKRDFLLSVSKLPQSDNEVAESLEQLRVLHHGYSIMVGVIEEPAFGIDTPEDYRRFVEMHQRLRKDF